MKRLLMCSVVVMLAVALVLGSCGEPEKTAGPTTTPTATPTTEQVLIRMTTPVPAGDDYVIWLQAGMDKFNVRTNGAYKMQMFPGGQLAAFPERDPGCVPVAVFR